MSALTPLEGRRKSELSILNVLFCLLVVLIHVLSHAVGNSDKLSWQYALVLIPQRLAILAVPGFFFLSGLKLTLPRREKQSLKNYYLGRVKKLLIPYLLAAAVYYLYFVRLGWYTFSPAQFLRETALGTLSAQFYFLIALIQFVLLAPFFRWLAEKYSPVVLLPLALGITWLSSVNLNDILNILAPAYHFPYGDRIFTSYLIYYLAGCCAGVHYQSFLTLLNENHSLLLILALFFGTVNGIFSLLSFSGRHFIPYLEEIHSLYVLTTIPVLYSWAIRQKDKISKYRLLSAIDQASYLIYLYHCLVITIFNRHAPYFVGERVSVLLLLRFLVVFPVSIAGCILWQHLWRTMRGRLFPAGPAPTT